MKKSVKITIYSICIILLLVCVLIVGPILIKNNNNNNPNITITLLCDDEINITPDIKLKFSNNIFKVDPAEQLANVKFDIIDTNMECITICLDDYVFNSSDLGEYKLKIYINDDIYKIISINVKSSLDTPYLTKTYFDVQDNINIATLVNNKYIVEVDNTNLVKNNDNLIAEKIGKTNINLTHKGVTIIHPVEILPVITIEGATSIANNKLELSIPAHTDISYDIITGINNPLQIDFVIDSELAYDTTATQPYFICFDWDNFDILPVDSFNVKLTITINQVSKSVDIKINITN